MTSIVWFRLDLRLADNPALNASLCAHGSQLVIRKVPTLATLAEMKT